jgi:hypothetical protein
MDMPKIQRCEVIECCYNTDNKCHALAITVGDKIPRCDTFTTACSSKAGDVSLLGKVGACKVSQCRYNMNLECQAMGINVGRGGDPADCLTYEPS